MVAGDSGKAVSRLLIQRAVLMDDANHLKRIALFTGGPQGEVGLQFMGGGDGVGVCFHGFVSNRFCLFPFWGWPSVTTGMDLGQYQFHYYLIYFH